jgi:hypothetical protein
MRALTAEELLRIWEQGLDQPPLEKSIRLLGSACSATDLRDISHLSIGERDARLLALREWMFGDTLRNTAECPKCKEKAEWEINTADLRLQKLLPDPGIRIFEIDKSSYFIRFRLLDSDDISRAIKDPVYRTDEKKILSDCILEARKSGVICDAADLPEPVWEAMAGLMSKEDPQADIKVKISCPICKHQWQAKFDIMSFFWAEIHNWAQRMIQEIYLLARSFGWSEKEILNMSDRRRQMYIQMLGT